MSELLMREAIANALLEDGLDYDPNLVVAIVKKALAPHETMTAGEREFLLDAGAPSDAFDPDRQTEVRTRLAAAIRPAQGLSTSQAAARLGRQASNVRRSAANRDLYAITHGTHRELVFPEWQFVDDKPLPGLKEVLAALPDDLHPTSIEAFMLSPHEELNDLAPVAWLATGGSTQRVMWLADSLSRE